MSDRLAVKDGVVSALTEVLKDPERPTLKDKFAMAALNGMLSHGSVWGSDEAMVRRCFVIARACMAERSKK